MKDLFGNETKQVKHPGAYPAPPGSGPAEKVCRQCGHYRSVGYHNKAYRKCAQIKWTNGAGTDIKASSPACRFFEAKEVTQ